MGLDTFSSGRLQKLEMYWELRSPKLSMHSWRARYPQKVQKMGLRPTRDLGVPKLRC